MMQITVAYAAPDSQVEIPLQVPENCSVAMAIDRSKMLERFPNIQLSEAIVGIHSRRVRLDAPLQPGDRVEIYRSLQIDPKEARRLRVQRSKRIR